LRFTPFNWRLGWRVHLLGPFYLGGTVLRHTQRRRRLAWHGTLPGWRCPHDHRREDTAVACAQRELRRRSALSAS
jgi:hypothetical protein